MELAISLAIGLIVGALATWLIQRDERRYLREELKVAHAQIAHAVMSEGAQIPARYEEPEPVEPLDSEYQACITQWEDPENQAIEEAKIRSYIAEGYGKPAILRQYGVKG